jgi:hypothetical protein
MGYTENRSIDLINPKVRRRILGIIMTAGFILSLGMGTLRAGAHEAQASSDKHHGNEYESKIYGKIEKMPPSRIGTWIVNGRAIIVVNGTKIKEKHGKAEPGAYVKIQGNTEGNVFTAYEIEVKESKR